MLIMMINHDDDDRSIMMMMVDHDDDDRSIDHNDDRDDRSR